VAVPSQLGSLVDSKMDYQELYRFGTLDPLQEHYLKTYHARELKIFQRKRAWKMPLSGFDPSMLIKFLCKDEADWWDPRQRVGPELPGTMY
jgi:cysteine protease ATG4